MYVSKIETRSYEQDEFGGSWFDDFEDGGGIRQINMEALG